MLLPPCHPPHSGCWMALARRRRPRCVSSWMRGCAPPAMARPRCPTRRQRRTAARCGRAARHSRQVRWRGGQGSGGASSLAWLVSSCLSARRRLAGACRGAPSHVACPAPSPAGLVGELAEQLRLILEPTLASRLAGDYRSGKRINMKKVGQAAAWPASLTRQWGGRVCAAGGSQGRLAAWLAAPRPRVGPPPLLPCRPSLGPGGPPHAAGHWLHCQPLPQGQDLDAPHPPGQAQVPGAGRGAGCGGEGAVRAAA